MATGDMLGETVMNLPMVNDRPVYYIGLTSASASVTLVVRRINRIFARVSSLVVSSVVSKLYLKVVAAASSASASLVKSPRLVRLVSSVSSVSRIRRLLITRSAAPTAAVTIKRHISFASFVSSSIVSLLQRRVMVQMPYSAASVAQLTKRIALQLSPGLAVARAYLSKSSVVYRARDAFVGLFIAVATETNRVVYGGESPATRRVLVPPANNNVRVTYG